MNVLRYFLAIVLMMHGIGHAMGFIAAWLPRVDVGFTGAPSILWSGATVESLVGKVFGLVWLAALLVTVAAGYGLFVGQAWWRTTAIYAAALSLAAILPWLRTVPPGAIFGGILVDVVILAVLLLPWGEQIERALQLP